MAGVGGAVLGLLGTLTAVYSQGKIDTQQIEIQRLDRQLQQRKIDSDIQLRVYDSVIKNGNEDLQKLKFSLALIEVLPDGPYREGMARILTNILIDAENRQENNPDLGNSDKNELKTARNTAAFLSGSGDIIIQSGSKEGWDIDVFYCENGGESKQVDALNAAKAIMDPKRGRIRVKALPASVNQQPGYQVFQNEIRADYGQSVAAEHEWQEASEIKTTIEKVIGTKNLKIEPNRGNPSEWYISVFFCKNVSEN